MEYSHPSSCCSHAMIPSFPEEITGIWGWRLGVSDPGGLKGIFGMNCTLSGGFQPLSITFLGDVGLVSQCNDGVGNFYPSFSMANGAELKPRETQPEMGEFICASRCF